MSSTYRQGPTLACLRLGQPVTALAFDPVCDTLWAGTNIGIVVALYSQTGIRGVSLPTGGGLAVQKIIAGEDYVRAAGLSGQGLGNWKKGGANQWFYRPGANVMTFCNVSQSVAISTDTSELHLVDSASGSVMRQVKTPSIINHISASNKVIVATSMDGHVSIYDPQTAMRKVEMGSALKVHTNGVQGLQIAGNTILTIGYGTRQGRPFAEPLVKLFDMRTMRPLTPLPCSDDPAFINILPRRSSTIAVTSNQGFVNIVDFVNTQAPSEFHQVGTSAFITSVDISPVGTYMAFGDAEGSIQLLTAAEDGVDIPFNGFEGKPIEWADIPEAPPVFDWSDSTPLNSIGLPHYDTKLLSGLSLPQRVISAAQLFGFSRPAKIPEQILASMKLNDRVAYAALPKELRGKRNVVVSKAVDTRSKRHFRSDKTGSQEFTLLGSEEVPPRYCKVEIQYSKFGIEDFDFGYYNKTPYSGLETHILNSYTNSVVQVMHYCLPIRSLAKSHITVDCPREHCLMCELGFVSRMLEDARGTNCQASNFCKTVGVLATAQNAIELIEFGGEATNSDYAHKIQTFNRFLLDRLSLESSLLASNIAPDIRSNTHPAVEAALFGQLLGLNAKTVVTCLFCGHMTERGNITHVLDMVYPKRISGKRVTFAEVIRESLIREVPHKATCRSCKRVSNFSSRRSISTRSLPTLIALHASIHSKGNLETWRTETFLQTEVKVQGHVDGIDDPDILTYRIRAIVAQICTKAKSNHLVAMIRVPEKNHGSNSASWFVFNDFTVEKISEKEALSFTEEWKTPALVYIEREEMSESFFEQQLIYRDLSILKRDTSISINRDPSRIKHEHLQEDELLAPGTFLAIDAEFVSMQQEEAEYRSDGTKTVLRPTRLSLARVSVLRGSGSKEGIPLVDDHIFTTETIVDYLTEFSGIKYGDLDLHISPYTLTPLKSVYKKLRLLIDLGCIFIGHGLSKDFRIINIYVPPEQIVDTVDLYYIESRHRRLSLRFLSYFVLSETIQGETHDSIEDARCALMLFRVYRSSLSKGPRVFTDLLEDLYKQGNIHNWKPPRAAGEDSPEKKSAHVSIEHLAMEHNRRAFQAMNIGTNISTGYAGIGMSQALGFNTEARSHRQLFRNSQH